MSAFFISGFLWGALIGQCQKLMPLWSNMGKTSTDSLLVWGAEWEKLKRVFPKLTQSTFWPTLRVHSEYQHINYATCPKLTHPPTHTPTPKHPSPHPVTSIQTSLTHAQTQQHLPPSPPCPHPHTQNGYLENKHLIKKLTQFNSLSMHWITSNLDWVLEK